MQTVSSEGDIHLHSLILLAILLRRGNAPGSYVRLPCNKVLAQEIADVYRRNDCWTWAEDWAFFDEECFMEAPRDEEGGAHHHLFPLNLFTIGERTRSMRVPLAAGAIAMSAMMGALLMENL